MQEVGALDGALLVDKPAASLNLLVSREAQVKHTADEDEGDAQNQEFGARIDLSYELASELSQKHFGIVAPCSGSGFDRRGFDKRCDDGFPGRRWNNSRKRADRIEVEYEFRIVDAKLVTILDFSADRDRCAVQCK